MKATVTSSGPGLDKIFKGLVALDGSDVLVGIPEANSLRKGKGINNAELLFIFTNGSPLHGQLPRVVIEDAIEAEPTKGLIAKYIGKAAIAAMDGDEAGMVTNLDKAGTIGESASKRWFTDPRNNWAPNTPSTIAAKGSDTPGVDTGQMRRAITHITEAKDISGGHEPSRNTSDDSRDVEASSVGGDVENVGETVGKGVESVATAIGEGIEAIGTDVVEGLEVIAL